MYTHTRARTLNHGQIRMRLHAEVYVLRRRAHGRFKKVVDRNKEGAYINHTYACWQRIQCSRNGCRYGSLVGTFLELEADDVTNLRTG